MTPGEQHRETILIVEDDAAMAHLVRTYLEHDGYEVEVADAADAPFHSPGSSAPRPHCGKSGFHWSTAVARGEQ